MRWPVAARCHVVIFAAVAVVVTAAVALVVLAALSTGDGDDAAAEHSAAASSEADADAGAGAGTEGTHPATTTATGGTSSATTTGVSASPSAGGIGDGLWAVGRDLEAGRYIAPRIPGSGCAWARLRDPAGVSVITSEDDVEGQAIVDILATDGGFRSDGCGDWELYEPPDEPAATTIGSGDWAVGEQVEPGAYLVARSPGCTWARATGFEHTPDEAIQTESSALSLEGPYLVVLEAGQRFTNRGCGRWADAD